MFISLVIMMAAFCGAYAMSFERAQEEALYLTDKMAYELNLNDQQYNDAYEINLDYFLSVDSPSDIYSSYYSYRLHDMRCILYDWQYSLFSAAEYFLRPVVCRAGIWYFPIYGHYRRGYFYYGRPSVWVSYRGGHSHYYHHGGYYGDRRPHWSGGFRGHDMHHSSAGVHHSSHGVGHNPNGNGYHFDVHGHRGGSMGQGNHGGGIGSGNSGSGHGYNGNHSGSGGNQNGSNHGGNSGNSGNHSGNGNGGNHGGNGGHSSGNGGSSHSFSSGNGSHGNSFDGSSSRMGGSSRGSGMGSSRGSSMGGSRGSGMGSSRGGRR